MTKSDLLKLPRKKLAEIAEEFSLSLDDYDSKEEFIEDLFEAAAEETRESLKANNTVSQIRRSKFVIPFLRQFCGTINGFLFCGRSPMSIR